MRPLTFLVLIACRANGYGITYPPELRQVYEQRELDAGVDCLVEQIEAHGLLIHGVAAKHIRASAVVAHTLPEPVEESPGMLRSGSYDPDGSMYFLWTPGADLAHSSFQHELVHAILCRAQDGPCDDVHAARAWWLVLGDAQACWADYLGTK